RDVLGVFLRGGRHRNVRHCKGENITGRTEEVLWVGHYQQILGTRGRRAQIRHGHWDWPVCPLGCVGLRREDCTADCARKSCAARPVHPERYWLGEILTVDLVTELHTTIRTIPAKIC